MVSLLAKDSGIGKEIIKNKNNLGKVDFAILSLAFLKGRVSTPLDVDLFIVGEVNFDLISKIVKDYESKIKKEINFSTMSSDEFLFRKRKNDSFIFRVLVQSRSMLIGDEEKFNSVA